MFWSKLNKISSVGKQISDTVGNASGSKKIAQIFHDKYKALYPPVKMNYVFYVKLCRLNFYQPTPLHWIL